MNLTVRADRRLIRTGHRSNRFVLLELTAPESVAEHRRAPVNLAFALDRSGSMAGQKIGLARRAVDEAIGRLHTDDRFAVVVYDDQIDVVAEGSSATPESRRIAVSRLREIDARGSTNLAEGWLRGCEQVALQQSSEGVNRVLLLTDGLANVGITDRSELEAHAAELRARGVTTSTFGVGNDFDESLLQAMADAGGGHFYYIERAAQIPDLVSSEVGETLEVVAHGVSLELTVATGVQVEALSPFPCETRGERATVRLGDLVSGQQLSVVLRLNFPYGALGEEVGVLFSLSGRDGPLPDTGGRLGWTYADGRSNDEQARDREVDRAVAGVFAARARQEAVGYNREGRYLEAARALDGVARRIRGYAAGDDELQHLAEALVAEKQRYAAPMPEAARKQAFFASSAACRMRDPQGRAIKRPPVRPSQP